MTNKPILVVSFSGGRTSAYMCWYLLENYSDTYQFIFVFANTGREHEETYRFVDRCDKYFDLKVVWLEGVYSDQKNIGPRHRVVTFDTADRTGAVFEEFISVEGIPNISRAKCSDYLKTQVIRSWLREQGLLRRGKKPKIAIGIRADEPDRNDMSKDSVKRFNLVYPLSYWRPTSKPEILDFWQKMPFDLYIPEHYGNCVTCFKKSNNKLYRIAHENPTLFQFNADMEKKYGTVKGDHQWWRGKRTTAQLIGDAKMIPIGRIIAITETSYTHDGCNGSCEAFTLESDEFLRRDDVLLSDDKKIILCMIDRGDSNQQIYDFVTKSLGVEAEDAVGIVRYMTDIYGV